MKREAKGVRLELAAALGKARARGAPVTLTLELAERTLNELVVLQSIAELFTTKWRGEVVCPTCGECRPRDIVPTRRGPE